MVRKDKRLRGGEEEGAKNSIILALTRTKCIYKESEKRLLQKKYRKKSRERESWGEEEEEPKN